MLPDHLEIVLLWVAYCAVHSLLISKRVTDFFKRTWAAGYSYYRLFFNLFSLGALIPLVIYSDSPRFRGSALFTWNGNWQIIRCILIAMAVALIIGGARHYSISQFLGIRQIRSDRTPGAMTDTGEFDCTGILGVIRHPWYVAVLLLIWSGNLNVGTVIINIVVSAYLVIGTLLEERKLVLEFGKKYREYQDRVSMFFPLKWMYQPLKRHTPLDRIIATPASDTAPQPHPSPVENTMALHAAVALVVNNKNADDNNE
jgi:methanethiol S-methyltransferase